MNVAAGKPDRVLLVIVSVIALLVSVALAVVFTHGEPELLDESTPQGVVQRYSTAVIDGDMQQPIPTSRRLRAPPAAGTAKVARCRPG